MNEEKWVLAQLKRTLVETVRNDENDYFLRDAYNKVLVLIANLEADSILGEHETAEDAVEKILKEEEPQDECKSCKIDLDEMLNFEGVK